MWNFSLTRARPGSALSCLCHDSESCNACNNRFWPKNSSFLRFLDEEVAPSSSGWCSLDVLQPSIDSAQPRALSLSSVSLPAPPSAKIVQLMNFAIDLRFTHSLAATAAALPGPRVSLLLFEARLWERRGVCMVWSVIRGVINKY